ncbi:hypothetical protein ACLKA7_017092 [Drosophila subpalustris]
MSAGRVGVGGGGGGGGGGDSSSSGCVIDELQDGENSQELEPGELVTPPHQQLQGSASPSLKKILSKDVMNKALRKSIKQDIDNDNDNDSTEPKNVRAILELEAIRRKEKSTQAQHTLENGKIAAENDNDDSEGLYSDTDSSTDEQQQQQKKQDVEDVQQARKEKQAEAAAAAKAAAPPTAPAQHHAFIGMSPLRFHMRPPCFDFSRMGFMPRMSRGVMRGMRPSFFPRPQVSKPPTKAMSGSGSSSNGAQGSAADPGAYGPALPPAQQGQDRTAGKRPQSELLWTSCQPPVSFLFQLVNDCGLAEHKECRQGMTQAQTKETAKEKHAKISKDPNKDQKEREPAKDKIESGKEKKLDKSKERARARSKDHLREKQRERSNGEYREKRMKERTDATKHWDNSREGGRRRERSKERREHHKQKQVDKRERSKEKRSERSREKPREPRERCDRSREKTRHRSKAKNMEQMEKQLERSQVDKTETSTEKQVEQQEHSKDKQMDQKERCPGQQRLRSREKPMEPRGRSRQRQRERSKEKSNRHKEKDKQPERSRDKDHSRDKSRNASRDRQRQRERSRSSHNNNNNNNSRRKSQSRRREIKAQTPPAAPPPAPHEASPAPESLPAAAVQDEGVQLEQLQPLTPPRAEAFDIFAESPPRLNKVRKAETSPPPERSTTPPLDKRHVIKSTSTTETGKLQMHSEIHSRIGALLEDDTDELHLEALLATKEQLLRKSREHRVHKKELHIKQEPVETAAPAARHANPFKRETVLTEATSRRCTASSRRSNGDRHGSSYSRHGHRQLESRERSIKREKNRSRTPPLLTARQIKVERDLTPPPRDAVQMQAKSDEHSPDTDDYIDNWENDDSMASTPKNAASVIVARLANGEDEDSNALWNAKSTPPPKAKAGGGERAKGDGDGEGEGGVTIGAVEGATPEGPVREESAQVADKALINIHDLYDKFMKSIKMGATATNEEATTTSELDASNTNINSSLSNSNSNSNSTATEEEDEDEDESSSTDSEGSTTSSSSSSSDSSEDEDEDEADSSSTDGEQLQQLELEQEPEQQLLSLDNQDQSQSQSSESASNPVKQSTPNHKKNNVSRDLRKMQSLEDNLARIQMMRQNYDSGDDICEELLKMESLFIMQRNAILNKYRKSELKSGVEELQLAAEAEAETEALPRPAAAAAAAAPASPVNNIFDANREAIKLTISPLKLSARKPAIFDKDELETTTTPASIPIPTPNPNPIAETKPVKPAKEIAIVKPTIMERARTQKPPPVANPLKRSRTRERSRSRSVSRQRFRRGFRGKDSTRSPSPRRRRHPLGRGRFGKGLGSGAGMGSRSGSRFSLGHSHSQSISRSRTRSRSPMRRRRLKPPVGAGRRRGSLSPPGKISYGPRSPPPPPYSRERCYSRSRTRSRSRSPLPFKPPSPPMRRSWSTSRSRSRSRSRSPHTRRRGSRSRSRSRSPRSSQSFSDYFVENQSMEAAAYYYNMSLMQQDAMQGQAPGHYMDMDMDMSAYMDTAYNMEHAYAQYSEYSAITAAAATGPDYDYGAGSNVVEASPIMPVVLRELPKAPVAVQKGNVLEIVPSMEASTGESLTIVTSLPGPEEQVEDTSQPKRKRVNFVDLVLPNYESGSEDRKAVERLMEHKVRVDQRRSAAKAAIEQRKKEQLLAVPFPPPPPGAKPSNVDKPVAVQKKPQLRYYHFDPVKALIFRSRERLLRGSGQQPQRFDPKYMAMLVKSGRLPMPPFMRHRPPPPPAQADAMLQEFFTLHPPPPLHHVMPHYLRGPPPAVTAAVAPAAAPLAPAAAPTAQPIPVLGAQSYPCFQLTAVPPVPAAVPAPLPVPLPLPLPLPLALPGTPPLTSTPPPTYFTPPPLPTLSSHFKVQPAATMREIMPVDILQKIGPLPKTLDLDVGNPGLDEPPTNADLTKDAPSAAPEAAAGDVQTPPQEHPLEA